jgi:hypothetical protein
MLPQLITAAVVGALSPIPALVTILLLSSPNPVWKTLAVFIGWTLVLVAIAILLIALLDPHPKATDHTAKAMVGLVVGALLIAVGARTLIGASHPLAAAVTGQEPADEGPKWMKSLDTLKVWQSFFLGMLLISPANVAVYFAAIQALIGQHLGTGDRVIVLTALLACMGLCILVPLLIYTFMPRRSAHLLDVGKRYLIHNQGKVSGWSAIVFGVFMLVNSTTTLL